MNAAEIHRNIRVGFHKAFSQTFDGIVASRNKGKNRIRIIVNAQQGQIDHAQEPGQIGISILDDLVQKKKQVVGGIGLDFRIAALLQDIEKNVQQEGGPFRASPVRLQQMEIIQRKAAGFLNNKTPIFVRMGKLGQEGIQPLHHAEVLGHYILERKIFGIDRDIHMIIGDIDLKGFGFKLGGRIQDYLAYIKITE